VEYRTAYRGVTERAWMRLDFRAPDGTLHTLDLVVDTASADAVILRKPVFDLLVIGPAQPYVSAWGFMHGGWLQLDMPACGLVQQVHGYANDIIGAGVAADDPNFVGLVGLPILRLGEYGGNATDFWFRYPPTSTPTSPP
jgi:hypothetical protein